MTVGELAPRRVNIVGIGLIGGSIGAALRQQGWIVHAEDIDEAHVARGAELGVFDHVGLHPDAEVTFIATPVQTVAEVAHDVLVRTSGAVTDVGSTKATVVESIDHPRFVGGHPMAGSEQEGVDGADPDLFQGAVWVLTPTAATDDERLAQVGHLVAGLGAEVVALPPDRHDALVAMVSHVPHLTAVTLMRLAADRAEEHAALLRLAAGGFRDMTRIASGHPGIWPGICAQNRTAIVEVLDRLIDGLGEMRTMVLDGDRDGLVTALETARRARTNLPARVVRPEEVAEVRIPVPDRAGVLAEVTTLAAELGVSIADLEIAHSSEGDRGVLIVLIATDQAERFQGGLVARGYRPSYTALS